MNINDRIEKNKIDFSILNLSFISNEDSFSFDIKNEDKQKDSNNSNQTKNSNLTQNNSKSSTKGSSEIGSNSIINPNKKENIFKVEHFDGDFLKSNLNNSSINLYCSKKRKKEKIKKENKINIRKETLDKIIFRRLFKFIRTNSEKDEISDIIKEDKSFFEEFLKNDKSRARKKNENNYQKKGSSRYLFYLEGKIFKSYNQQFMEYIFSRKSVKKFYKIYFDKDKNYHPKILERLKLKLNKFEYEKYKRYFKY